MSTQSESGRIDYDKSSTGPKVAMVTPKPANDNKPTKEVPADYEALDKIWSDMARRSRFDVIEGGKKD